MPAGDAQRAWFPEMLSELKQYWVHEPDWRDVVKFCEKMTSLRSAIREQRGIRGPMMTCRSCGKKHTMSLPPISPRSLLFALRKIDIIADDELKHLDKEWKCFRKNENLDAHGHRKTGSAEDASQSSTCT